MSPDPDDPLSPAASAEIAERSVRTIRRADLEGTVAYRDGNGRGDMALLEAARELRRRRRSRSQR